MKKLDDVFEEIGGTAFMAYKLGMHQASIDSWLVAGVPAKHWRKLIDLAGGKLNLTELLDINEDILARKRG